METKTLNDIIEKYPKIYELLNDGFYRISSGVPDSWIKTIDWLSESIQSYIDNINEHNKHLEPIQQVKCTQIKDKFGGLRFYYEGGNQQIEGMVHMAETILWNTCENCGSNDNLTTTGGWIARICDKCLNEKK